MFAGLLPRVPGTGRRLAYPEMLSNAPVLWSVTVGTSLANPDTGEMVLAGDVTDEHSQRERYLTLAKLAALPEKAVDPYAIRVQPFILEAVKHDIGRAWAEARGFSASLCKGYRKEEQPYPLSCATCRATIEVFQLQALDWLEVCGHKNSVPALVRLMGGLRIPRPLADVSTWAVHYFPHWVGSMYGADMDALDTYTDLIYSRSKSGQGRWTVATLTQAAQMLQLLIFGTLEPPPGRTNKSGKSAAGDNDDDENRGAGKGEGRGKDPSDNDGKGRPGGENWDSYTGMKAHQFFGHNRRGKMDWAPMHVVEVDRNTRHVVRQHARKLKPSDEGVVPGQLFRLCIDGAVFQTKKRVLGASVLVDGSGSMGWSIERLHAVIEACPASIVGLYAGRGVEGSFAVIAKDGWQVDEMPRFGGSNLVDGPALEWLAKQPAPRFWLSDGGVTGVYPGGDGEDGSMELSTRARLFCERYQIMRVENAAELVQRLESRDFRYTGWGGLRADLRPPLPPEPARSDDDDDDESSTDDD